MFLARTFNKSPTWTVEHEPKIWKAGGTKWGAVCSKSRWDWQRKADSVDHTAIILRHPLLFLISQANRTQFDSRWKLSLKWFHPTLELLDRKITDGTFWMTFENITTKKAAVLILATEMGVEDLRAQHIDLKIKYNTKPYTLRASEMLQRQDLPTDYDWFVTKYNLKEL